jgi:hypothetical protein
MKERRKQWLQPARALKSVCRRRQLMHLRTVIGRSTANFCRAIYLRTKAASALNRLRPLSLVWLQPPLWPESVKERANSEIHQYWWHTTWNVLWFWSSPGDSARQLSANHSTGSWLSSGSGGRIRQLSKRHYHYVTAAGDRPAKFSPQILWLLSPHNERQRDYPQNRFAGAGTERLRPAYAYGREHNQTTKKNFRFLGADRNFLFKNQTYDFLPNLLSRPGAVSKGFGVSATYKRPHNQAMTNLRALGTHPRSALKVQAQRIPPDSSIGNKMGLGTDEQPRRATLGLSSLASGSFERLLHESEILRARVHESHRISHLQTPAFQHGTAEAASGNLRSTTMMAGSNNRALFHTSPVSRELARSQVTRVNSESNGPTERAPTVLDRPPPSQSVPVSPIDINDLTERIYGQIERKVRTERERRGL